MDMWPMGNSQLAELLAESASIIDGETGFWRVEYRNRILQVVTDERYNRMRVMTPIVAAASLTADDLRTVLNANFDRALDAKYAIAMDWLWSLFTHPLAELQEEQFRDALLQVATLADNFGKTYSSGPVAYRGGGG